MYIKTQMMLLLTLMFFSLPKSSALPLNFKAFCICYHPSGFLGPHSPQARSSCRASGSPEITRSDDSVASAGC